MASSKPVNRATVDLTSYPDLIAIYLGMRVKSLRGLRTLAGVGPAISKSVAAKPDGLLLHETMLFSLFPLHVGFRQYWRDLDSLERWTREGIHRDLWTGFLRDPGGTGFWHETYRMRGGFEAIYDDMDGPVGLSGFAPVVRAKGPMFSARNRLGDAGPAPSPPLVEAELDGL
jgi:hypothetical protein